MITMSSPMVCLATHLNYKPNSIHKALLDLDYLVQEARRNSYPSSDIQFYSRQFKRKLFTHYYSRVKQLA